MRFKDARLAAMGFMVSLALCCPTVEGEDCFACINFGDATKALHWRDGAASFDGFLPESLTPVFAPWTGDVVQGERRMEAGVSFLRFNVLKYSYQADFAVATTKPLESNCIYRIDAKFRSRMEPLQFHFLKDGAKASYFVNAGAIVSNTPQAEVWTNGSLLVDLRKKMADGISLRLLLRPGITDIASLKLCKVTQDELQAGFHRPAKDVANYFRNSRFPLGLQSGWNFDCQLEKGGAEPDESSPGPSGAPSLKVCIENHRGAGGNNGEPKFAALYSEPFQTAFPSLGNSVSFAYKSSGSWIAVMTDNSGRSSLDRSVLARITLPPSDNWTTARLDFVPAPLAKSLTLAFAGKGTLWLDSLRAWAGDGSPAYVSQGECEAALGFPESDASSSRIQFADEPAALDYCVTGDFDQGVLKAKVVNLYGDETTVPGQRLGLSWFGEAIGADSPTLERGTVDFSQALADKPFGQFRVEVWVERGGKRISPFNEMVVTRIRRPVHWGEDAPESPFGCHFMSSPIIIPTMKAAGINWVRLHDAGTPYMGWFFLEPEKGKWAFRDEAIQRFRAGKIKIGGDLQTAPLWASSFKNSSRVGKPDAPHYFDRYHTIEDWDGWSNYVKTVCARYKGVIDTYYVWNEPYLTGFFHDATLRAPPDVAVRQARLCSLASKAAKEVSPDIKVAGVNLGGGEAFTKSCVKAGGFASCDFADYHSYTESETCYPGDTLEGMFHSNLDALLDTGVKKPLHMSEGTAVCSLFGPYTGLYKHSIPWEGAVGYGNLKISNATCRFVVKLLSLGMERINLYSAGGYSYLGVPTLWFTVLGEDGYPHPSLAAHANMACHLEGRTFVKFVPVGEQACAYLFEGRGGTVAVIAGMPNGTYTVPEFSGRTVSDLFGNPSDCVYQGLLLYVASNLPADKLADLLQAK